MDIENGEKLTCCGDEPLTEECEKYAMNSDWLMHEAFCLYSERDIFDPYEKHHSTVKDICGLAHDLNIKNLILYHTEEGSKYYKGNLYIHDDLETIYL